MPVSLPSLSAAVVCDGKELETYNVEQESASFSKAFIASEAGKQFKITFSNSLVDFELAVFLYIDGRLVRTGLLRPGTRGEFLGLYKNVQSILPFKFQELQLVDPDEEDADDSPEMGMIVLKAYRCQTRHTTGPSQHRHEDLHWGRVSERSKKAGWHHISTGEEMPARRTHDIVVDYLDLQTGPPYASIQVIYRPRELLKAQGIIPANSVSRHEIPVNNKKRAREDGSAGPSRSHPKIKKEEFSADARVLKIRALQAELDALRAAEESDNSVKSEFRSPSPIVVRRPGEVVDLTIDV